MAETTAKTLTNRLKQILQDVAKGRKEFDRGHAEQLLEALKAGRITIT